MICTSVAALALASGSALAQSERMGPGAAGAGAGAPAATEMAPQGSELPGSGAERGLDTPGFEGEGNAGVDAEGSAASGASEGEAGVDGSYSAEPSEAQPDSETLEQAPDASDGASDGAAGRDDASEMNERGARRGDRNEAGPEDGSNANASEGASEGAEGMDKGPSGSLTKLEGEKRTKVQSAFRSHRSEAVVNDIDVDISIGTSIPSSVSLYAVPQDVVVIVPEYRSYKYFIYDDRVVIVDPGTLAIIDILVLV